MPVYALGDIMPAIGEGTWIAPSADIIGDVCIGNNVNIWFGAIIRGDNSSIVIEERTNIQDGAMLHSDPGVPLTVGSGVTVGHHAVLHGCTIASNVLIGMNAVILNEVVIGENCLIGAGALVTEGSIFPGNSLILGVPAKVKRELTSQEILAIHDSARNYTMKAALFCNSLIAIG